MNRNLRTGQTTTTTTVQTMSDSSIIFVELLRTEREKVERKLFSPPGECMNTDKEENRKMREKLTKHFSAREKWEERESRKEREKKIAESLDEWVEDKENQEPIENFVKQVKKK